MSYNLTESQKNLARWLAQKAEADELPEEFWVHWISEGGGFIGDYEGEDDRPPVSQGALDALTASDLILSEPHFKPHGEDSRRVTLKGKIFEAVGSDFNAPDVSFVQQLTPLADVTNLDDELKGRVLPILGAGSADPKLWDSAVRTSGVILEERLRDVGGIADPGRVGRDLVNDVFGSNSSLTNRFSNPSER